MKKKEKQRYGTVAILGEINVGKSTLFNQFLKNEISTVTHKANTTRDKVKGITSDGDTQIVLIDTPGISSPSIKTNRKFLSQVWSSVAEANFLILVVDCKRPISRTLFHLFNEFKTAPVLLPEAILVINKIDKCSKERLLAKSKEFNDAFQFEKTFMISALKGHGVSDLRSWILAKTPKESWVYPKTKNHDMTMEKFLEEKTREIILLRIHKEVPYNLEVATHEIENLRDGSIKVRQFIDVNNVRHRAMLVGKGGQTIKSISSTARLRMEKVLKKKVHLFLEVKVKKKKKDSIQSRESFL